MTRLLWLPTTLDRWLKPAGYRVELVSGWERRGAAFPASPLVVIGHHTATSARARGNLPTLGVLRDGRPDLPGPLCQIGLGRDGTAYVIASGKANHAGVGTWHGIESSARTVGIEAEHPGDGSPWTDRQLAAFDLVAVALLEGLHRPALSYCGHREWARPAGRKPDPRGVDLSAQRRRIGNLLARGPRPVPAAVTTPKPAPAPVPPTPEDDIVYRFKTASDPQQHALIGGKVKPLTPATIAGLVALKVDVPPVVTLPDDQAAALIELGR